MALSNKHQAFVDSLFSHNLNATDAYLDVYSVDRETAAVNGSKLLRNTKIAEAIKARMTEKAMGADEVLMRLGEQARGDLSVFFKVVEEWTFYPLPTYEIIDAKEVEDTSDPDKTRMRISFWVRHIVIDLEKVMDPQYSGLLHKFTDSPKDGMGIEIYNKQAALQTLAKIHGLLINKTEISGKDGKPIEIKEVVYEMTDAESA